MFRACTKLPGKWQAHSSVQVVLWCHVHISPSSWFAQSCVRFQIPLRADWAGSSDVIAICDWNCKGGPAASPVPGPCREEAPNLFTVYWCLLQEWQFQAILWSVRLWVSAPNHALLDFLRICKPRGTISFSIVDCIELKMLKAPLLQPSAPQRQSQDWVKSRSEFHKSFPIFVISCSCSGGGVVSLFSSIWVISYLVRLDVELLWDWVRGRLAWSKEPWTER